MTRALRTLAFAAMLTACAACDNADVVTPPPPPGPACLKLEDHLHTLAIARPGGRTFDATVAGTLAFTANDLDGVFIADFSDPTDVSIVGAVPSLVDARAVNVVGSLLFVANGAAGLAVIDVSNPAAPQVRGVATMPGKAVDVDAIGTLAFVANDALGLVIVDASDPAAPAIRGIENTPGKAVGVAAAASEALVFVADEMLGVRVVNIADVDAPFLIRSIGVTGVAQAVAVESGVVAVAAREGGLVLIAPVPAGGVVKQFATPANALGVALANKIAFVADATEGVRVIDVHDPANPVEINSLGPASYAQDVAVAEGKLVISDDGSGARVVDIANAPAPPLNAIAGIGDASAVALFGDLALIADASYGLRVVDPATRRVVSELAIAGAPLDVIVADSLAYVTTSDNAVAIVDLHDPVAPVSRGFVPGVFGADAVAVKAPFIYFLASGGTVLEKRLDGSGTPRDFTASDAYFPSFTLDDPYIYLPDRRGNIWVLVRASMSLAAILPVGGSAERVVIRYEDGPFFPIPRVMVAISGLANGQAAIETWDYTTLFNPLLLSTVACGGNAVDLAFDGAWMAVAEAEDGCEVFDLAGAAPRAIGYVSGPTPRVAVVNSSMGSTIVIAGGNRGLFLVSPQDCLR